jgi:hypothetical protein
MKALRQQVERVVRPLRASTRTKDRMRAELLAHLTLLYHEELAIAADAATALNAASRRLGDPALLTQELQASVTLLEQWTCVPLPGTRWGYRRRSESIGKWIFRTTTAGSLASGVTMALVVVLLAALNHKVDRLGAVVPFLLGVPFLMWITLVTNFSCSEWIRRQIESADPPGKRLSRFANVLAGGMLTLLVSMAVAAVMAVMLLRSDADHLVSREQAAVGCAAWGALMVVVLAIQVRDWIAAARRFDDWESLDLNDDCQGSLSV